MTSKHARRLALRVAALLVILPAASSAQQAPPAAADVTFTKDIAPILQRSCQQCHRPGGVAPMPLITYEQVRPWARAIKTRTGLGPRAGVMPRTPSAHSIARSRASLSSVLPLERSTTSRTPLRTSLGNAPSTGASRATITAVVGTSFAMNVAMLEASSSPTEGARTTTSNTLH